MDDRRHALDQLTCPLCGSQGTLRPIRIGRRLRLGLITFVLLLGKTVECTGCGVAFGTADLVRAHRARA